jgi:hypothetical protein
MALPTSGPLSLTDIQTEFFGGVNPISLSEYYAGGGLVPLGTTGTYGAVPSSGAISIRNFYGTANFRYFLLGFSESVPFNTGVVDAGNLIRGQTIKGNFAWTGGRYIVRSLDGTTTVNSAYITKLNVFNGSVIEQKYDLNSTDIVPVSVDSSDNIYIRGATLSGTSLGNRFIAKLDNNYNTLWAYKVNIAPEIFALNVGKVRDSLYVGGRGIGDQGIITQIDSDTIPLVNNWAKSIVSGTNPRYSVTGITTDSSENYVYVAGSGLRSDTLTVHLGFLMKFFSFATLDWQRRITPPSGYNLFLGDVIISSDDTELYVAGTTSNSDIPIGLGYYAKHNSSGVRQWAILFNVGSRTAASNSKIVLGPTGRLFVAMGIFTTPPLAIINRIYIAEINPSTGAQIWARQITSTTSSGTIQSTGLQAISVSDDGNEDLIISCIGSVSFTFKVPSDGSKTGTYSVVAASGNTFNLVYGTTTASLSTTTSYLDAAGSFTITDIDSSLLGLTATPLDFTQSVPAYDETVVNDIVTIP